MAKKKKVKKGLHKKVKKMDLHDLQLIKLSTTAFVLFLMVVWPELHNLVMGVHWGWFLGAGILFAIRPSVRILYKKK